MGLSCKVSYTDNNVARVEDDLGFPSKLYQGLLEELGNQSDALVAWATAYTPDLQNKGESATVEEVLGYLDAKSAEESRLNAAETFQVRDFMIKNGFERLSDLHQQMVSIFKPNGVFEVNAQMAIDSGLYSSENIQNLNEKQLSDILTKIEGQLIIEDIYVTPESQENEYVNDREFTVFGTNYRYSEEEVFRTIRQVVENPMDPDSFELGIKDTGLTGLIDKYYLDPEFSRKVTGNMTGAINLPRLIVNTQGQIQEGTDIYYETVKNTLQTELDTTDISEDIDFLSSISPEVWNENLDLVNATLEGIEKDLVDQNIDLIGLSKQTNDREQVISILQSLRTAMETQDDSDIQAFAQRRNEVFPMEDAAVWAVVPENMQGRTLFYLDTQINDVELFNQYGLIKVQDNVYHKTDPNGDPNLAMDQIAKSDLKVPAQYQISNNPNPKVRRLENVTNLIMSKAPRSLEGINSPILYAAYLNYFGHSEIKTDLRNLSEVQTSEDYLTTEFVSDFYNYYLREKLRNSDIYKSVLSNFQFTNTDINLKDRIESLQGVEMRKELEDYIRLKKNSQMSYLVDKSNVQSEDLAALNDPEYVKEYSGYLNTVGDYAISDNDTTTVVMKHNGSLYRQVLQQGTTTLFQRVSPNTNTTYNTASDNFEFDREAAQEVLDRYLDNRQTSMDQVEYQAKISRARGSKISSPKLRELSTLKDPSYTFSVDPMGVSAFLNGQKIGSIRAEQSDLGMRVVNLDINQRDRGKGVSTEMTLLLLDRFPDQIIELPAEDFSTNRYIGDKLGLRESNGNFIFNPKENSQLLRDSGVPVDQAKVIYDALELNRPTSIQDREVTFNTKTGTPLKFNLKDISLNQVGQLDLQRENTFEIKAQGKTLGKIRVQFENANTATISLAGLNTGSIQDKSDLRQIIDRIMDLLYDLIRKKGPKFSEKGQTNSGKGIGKVAYETLAIKLKDDFGADLLSDTRRSDKAEGLWRSFERAGKAIAIEDIGEGKPYRYKFQIDQSISKSETIAQVYDKFKAQTNLPVTIDNIRAFRDGTLDLRSEVQNQATIFQNSVEVVPLYSTAESVNIDQEINSCG